MAWYYGTYSCGHEGRVNIIGPVKDRQWKADRHFEKVCPDCWKIEKQKKKDAEYERACEAAKEMDLPELRGTEKQIRWAMVIRQKFIENAEKYDCDNNEKKQQALDETVEYYLTTKTKASWWIDNEFYASHFLVEHLIVEMLKERKAKETEETKREIAAEATVYPENAVSGAPVEIKIADDKVSAIYEKNEKFREIVRSLGYSWSGKAWEREIKETTGLAVDRAAELGNKLLNAGFPVTILDNEARQKAIDGTYEPECKRWIRLRITGDHAGKLAITWGHSDDLFNIARRLPGAKWVSKAMVVRPDHYEEMEEFARLYGFRFTKAAAEAIEAAKQARASATVIKPAVVTEEKPKNGLNEILNSSADVLEDLKD